MDKKICGACKGRSKSRNGLNSAQLNKLHPKIALKATRHEKINILKKTGICKKACKKTKKSSKKKKISKKMKKLETWTFYANAYLLMEHELDEKKVTIDSVVPKKQLGKVIKDLHVMGTEIIKIGLEIESDIKTFQISWQKTKLIVKLEINQGKASEVFKSIVDSYHEGAMDGYLEGDAKLYENMEFILDNFEMSDGQRTVEAKNYWT